MARDGDTWIVIGASPSVPAFTDAVRLRNLEAISITCNEGINLLGGWRLSYYYLSDMVACRSYSSDAYDLQGRGARLITLSRKHMAMEGRGVDRFDVFLELAGRPTPTYVRGVTSDVMFSRLFCTQFALNANPRRMIWMGMEKYPDRIKHARQHNERYIQPFLQSCMDACPDVSFEFCGVPGFKLSAPNLRVFPTVDEYEEHHASEASEVREAMASVPY